MIREVLKGLYHFYSSCLSSFFREQEIEPRVWRPVLKKPAPQYRKIISKTILSSLYLVNIDTLREALRPLTRIFIIVNFFFFRRQLLFLRSPWFFFLWCRWLFGSWQLLHLNSHPFWGEGLSDHSETIATVEIHRHSGSLEHIVLQNSIIRKDTCKQGKTMDWQ